MIIEKKKGGHRYYGDNKIEKDFRTIYRVIRRYFFFFYSRQNIRGNRYRQNFKFWHETSERNNNRWITVCCKKKKMERKNKDKNKNKKYKHAMPKL